MNDKGELMTKTILITGSTDGIGFAAAKMLIAQGHKILLHGRNAQKLADTKKTLGANASAGQIETFQADLSRLSEVRAFADAIAQAHDKLDVLINNAGVLKVTPSKTRDGYDVRFVVNTVAPYLLTKLLLPLMDTTGRVINLSSAAQSSIDLDALMGRGFLSDMDAYAQSKLAMTSWSHWMAHSLAESGPLLVAVNPGSMLSSKMVREGFGVAGNDINIGAEILMRAATADEFSNISGQYFDNDIGRFGTPHPDALDEVKSQKLIDVLEELIANIG